MKLITCKDCGYEGLINIDREDCRHCGGKLEIYAQEFKKNG